jgi:signal transduction histidine kinase
MIPLASLTFATILGHAATGTSGWAHDRARRLRLEHLEHQKQQFTDMLVHDLRNQLAPVSMAFSIDSEKARRDATPMPRHLAAGQQSLSRTMVMLNTLLDIRRTTAGRMPVSPSVFSLADLLSGLAETYRPMATRRGLSIETDAGPNHAQVVLDPDLVQRILENLLLNALQYAAKHSTIEIEGSVQNPHVVLELRNHGPAIPPRERERIFELFGTGSTTERRTFGGTGIGLAFCRQAVDAMGGQIDIESPWRDGQGVRIILTLPQGAESE